MATQEKTWNVANRLHSLKDSDNPEVNHIIAGADEIYDDTKGAKQSDINAQTDSRLSTVESDINEPASGMKDRLTTLEEQVEFEGEIQVENDPAGIVSGSGKVATANAVRGAIDAATDVHTSGAYATDLDIADDHGNVLMRMSGGHVKTKNFDSSKNALSEADVAKVAGIEEGAQVNDIVTDNIESADLTLSDENNNILAMFKDGHIKTKNFDSSEDEFIRKYLRDKKIVFIGDSLTDTRASLTPWYYVKFVNKTGCVPYNRGWSGSTVATGYNSMCDRLDLPANDSQERDANHLGFPSTADIVFFFGGTNDWCRLKDQAYGDLLAPATKETFCGAVKYMITGLKNRYPQSDIIVLNLHHVYSTTSTAFREVTYEDNDETKAATISVNNSGKSKEDYSKAIKECADMYGLPVVDMANVGFSAILNTDNQLYYVDGVHLTELGGEVMANYLIKQLKTILSKH